MTLNYCIFARLNFGAALSGMGSIPCQREEEVHI
jgi:hypothetical protein